MLWEREELKRDASSRGELLSNERNDQRVSFCSLSFSDVYFRAHPFTSSSSSRLRSAGPSKLEHARVLRHPSIFPPFLPRFTGPNQTHSQHPLPSSPPPFLQQPNSIKNNDRNDSLDHSGEKKAALFLSTPLSNPNQPKPLFI